MYRKVTSFLQKWKASPFRKPLIISGARQVGKTFSILSFGHEAYDNVAYFNFQTNVSLAQTFDENVSPSYLLPLLSRIAGQTILPEKTLVVFDEVQLCERALTSLKYFCEEAPNIHIIAAGSLLGVAVNRNRFSFPVGKVDRYSMGPMDLEEFMLAMHEDEMVAAIHQAYETDTPLPTVMHKAALDLYRRYLVVGGMPEAVSRFMETGDFLQVRHVQKTILMDYLDDMSKYQESVVEIKKTRLTYDTLTVQLSKKNTRFLYKMIKTGGRAAEFENAVEWLVMAGLISRVYLAEQIMKPLENYRNIDNFKVYLSDTGLLCAQKDVVPTDIILTSQELNDFKGGLTENYVNIQLLANGIMTYYWASEQLAEVDFVIQLDGKLIPLEVKSADNTRAKSLHVYMNRFAPPYAVKISEKNFSREGAIKTIPLYAVFCIKDGNVPQY